MGCREGDWLPGRRGDIFAGRRGNNFIVGKREDTQKYADPKAGGWRQEHLSGVYRFLQLQG